MAWYDKKFKPEYDAASGELKTAANYADDWKTLVGKLDKLMAAGGFDAGQAGALDDLRKAAKHVLGTGGKGTKKATVDHGLLAAVKAWTDSDTGSVDADKLKRAAALKLLHHIYLLNKSGNKKVWVVSLPVDFQDWPSADFANRATKVVDAKKLLASKKEQFDADAKKHLASATSHALSWCQKTIIQLALAEKGDKKAKGTDEALKLVQRWFDGGTVSATDLTTYITKLHQGFKDIIAMLNKGNFILTDFVPLRGSTVTDEIGFRNSEAFTFRSKAEGLDVVYIESSFFKKDAGGIVHGSKNWTRIIVHELTHMVCGTEDVVKGKARYAWYGIGPHAGYPGSDAVRNADNWAFFCLDCAKMLTDGERKKALKII